VPLHTTCMTNMTAEGCKGEAGFAKSLHERTGCLPVSGTQRIASARQSVLFKTARPKLACPLSRTFNMAARRTKEPAPSCSLFALQDLI
jgi:hypothetical protein